MDANTIALLTIAGAMVSGFGGIVATIFSTANGTNRRIDDLKSEMDVRFVETDRRFDMLHSDMDRRFQETERKVDSMSQDMNRRFSEMDRKIDSLKHDMEGRMMDMKTDLREVRGRVDYIADSLGLGRARLPDSA